MTSPASAHPGRTVPKANSPAGLSVLLKKSSAFSLIELLVVISIIGILSAAAIGGLSNVARSTNLTSAAQRLGDQFALARQLAVARNLPVEVRIYKLPDFDSTTNAILWRGLQLFIKEGTNDVPASRPLFFPQRVIISENAQASPLLSGLVKELTPLSNVGAFTTANVLYKSFTIRPNGTVTATNSIPDANWFLTVHHANDAKPDGGITPANFATVQINPVTSKVTILRP